MQTFSVKAQDSELDYMAEYNRQAQGTESKKSSRRPQYARAGARPVGLNGIHRRRNKRWSW